MPAATGAAYHSAMHPDVDNPAAGSPRYLDRELSWLEFNARVLALAENASLPLLERAKFLAIFSSNLDEFFQVRVSGLEGAARSRDPADLAGGHRPGRAAQRDPRARRGARDAARPRCSPRTSRPALQEAGVEFCDWDDLDDAARAAAHERVRRPHLPGAHSARRRPRAPVPVHLEPVAQPRGRRARRQRPASSASPASRCRRCSRASSRCPASSRFVAARAGDRRAPRRAVPRHGGARALRVPRHPRRRLRALRRRRRPPRRDGVRAAPAHEVRCRGAPRGRRAA